MLKWLLEYQQACEHDTQRPNQVSDKSEINQKAFRNNNLIEFTFNPRARFTGREGTEVQTQRESHEEYYNAIKLLIFIFEQ